MYTYIRIIVHVCVYIYIYRIYMYTPATDCRASANGRASGVEGGFHAMEREPPSERARRLVRESAVEGDGTGEREMRAGNEARRDQSSTRRESGRMKR